LNLSLSLRRLSFAGHRDVATACIAFSKLSLTALPPAAMPKVAERFSPKLEQRSI
jgi:hypothetical protein